MFDRLAPRPSFDSERSVTISLKDKLRALVIPKQTSNSFNLLNDSQSDTWSLSSTASRPGTSPVGWAGSSSHALNTPPLPLPSSRLSPPIPMTSTPRPKFYTQSSSSSAKSTHSLRLDPRYHVASGSASYIDDPYLAKQLSPIAEQDHFSPERRSLPLPSGSERDRDTTITASSHLYNSSPDGSEIARPSPVFSTFLTRPLNRSMSQNSSRTHISTVSLPPSFPTDGRSFSGISVSSRPPISNGIRPMPTIPGSTEGPPNNVFDDGDSARSFVTASSLPIDHHHQQQQQDQHPAGDHTIAEEARRSHYSINIESESEPATFHYADGEAATQAGLGGHHASAEASYFARNWRRASGVGGQSRYAGSAMMASFPRLTRRKARFYETVTPACWMFWLGFVAPWCWILGGWYFTIRGETRPTVSVRKGKGLGRKSGLGLGSGEAGAAAGKKLPLPSWILEKKGMPGVELSEKEAALNGIWFGYPYVAPPSVRSLPMHSKEGGGLSLSPSVLDPWIFRCRVAAWTGAGMVVVAFVTAFIVVGKKYG